MHPSQTPLQAVQPPRISPLEPLTDLPADDRLFDGVLLEQVLDWPQTANGPWQFDACKLEQCSLQGQAMTRSKLWDSIVVRSDLSAVRCFEAGWLRSELLGCRLSGIQLGEGSLRDVNFQNCKLDLASFRSCKLERVVFTNCVLTEADFSRAQLTDVAFIDCELEGTAFDHTKCVRVDFTRSQIHAIKGATSLKGARITHEQMMELAPLLCAEVGFILD